MVVLSLTLADLGGVGERVFLLVDQREGPLGGHRVLKTARIVASGLTFCIAPVLIAAMLFTAGAV